MIWYIFTLRDRYFKNMSTAMSSQIIDFHVFLHFVVLHKLVLMYT